MGRKESIQINKQTFNNIVYNNNPSSYQIHWFDQALKYLKIGTCPASQKLLASIEKMLIYIGNHPKFHLPCSLRHS